MHPKVCFLTRSASYFVVLSLTSLFGWATANAQEQIDPAPITQPRIPDLLHPSETQVDLEIPVVSEWQVVSQDAPGSEVSKILAMAGWNKTVASAELQRLSGADKFSLFVRSVSPGISDFLVVPQDENKNQPIEFKSAASSGQFHTAGWTSTSATELRDEILKGMQAAIDSLCAMDARPSEITVKASAAGILEVEAKWLTVEVCVPT